MEDKEREEYEEKLHEKDEQISDLMEELNNAIELLQEIKDMTKRV